MQDAVVWQRWLLEKLQQIRTEEYLADATAYRLGEQLATAGVEPPAPEALASVRMAFVQTLKNEHLGWKRWLKVELAPLVPDKVLARDIAARLTCRLIEIGVPSPP